MTLKRRERLFRSLFLLRVSFFVFGRQSSADIGAMFAKAVYLSKEVAVVSDSNVFSEELGLQQHLLYDAVSAAHFGKFPAKHPEKNLFLLKEFDGNHFLSNGYDVFFSSKSANLDLQRCCAVVLLDFFNASLNKTPFAKLCGKAEVVRLDSGISAIASFLNEQPQSSDTASVLSLWTSAERKELIPRYVVPKEKRYGRSSDEEEEELEKKSYEGDEEEECCCPFHCPMDDDDNAEEEETKWDATKNRDVTILFNSCKRLLDDQVLNAAMVIMGTSIKLSAESFVVRNNLVHVLADTTVPAVNFASVTQKWRLCWSLTSLQIVLEWGEPAESHCCV
jgi:hypothetical protein